MIIWAISYFTTEMRTNNLELRTILSNANEKSSMSLWPKLAHNVQLVRMRRRRGIFNFKKEVSLQLVPRNWDERTGKFHIKGIAMNNTSENEMCDMIIVSIQQR